MPQPICSFHVAPHLPPRLKRLSDLAYNLRWSWDHDTIDLFRRLDRDLWESCGHNPVRLLGEVAQEKLERAAGDTSVMAHLDRVCRSLDEYMAGKSAWDQRAPAPTRDRPIAYFCAEYGITECLPFYAGGLGVLAGDHLKSASDLNLPLVGVGLLYQEGYFRQLLNRDGWQEELYPVNDFHNLPIRPELGKNGDSVTIEVAYPGRQVKAQVWRAQVGRIPLFLLDTNLSSNSREDRGITGRLYNGGTEVRIRQEMMLGIGGFRALRSLGIHPSVCHLNEGHTAFAALERTREIMQEQGIGFQEAREAAVAGFTFTTHTPVRAGIDMFPPELVEQNLAAFRAALGLSREDFLDLGRQNPGDCNEPFCMAILALKLSSKANGVSRQHGQVARRMWQGLWPGAPEEETPIAHVTNGVHHLSWVSGYDVYPLLIRYLGDRWLEDPSDERAWQGLEQMPDEELWRTHERRRERLVAFARRRLRAQFERRGAPATELAQAGETLDPAALTIGFGRRFATYKRADLLLRDPDRLARILSNADRPVQIVFAGKAHPEDAPAKELIRYLVHFARQDNVHNRIVFLEDYDLTVARYMVQGCDVWLNTASHLQEASGTSGMKAAVNGVINITGSEGWWAEVQDPGAGWTIGIGDTCGSKEHDENIVSQDLYDLLEKEVVPLFYERGGDRLPRGWIKRMKASMRAVCPQFNTHRMVKEYYEKFYVPCASRQYSLAANAAARSRTLGQWKDKLRRYWPQLHVAGVEALDGAKTRVGSSLRVRAQLHLGALSPEDVSVELYHGLVNAEGQIRPGLTAPMSCVACSGQNDYLFEGSIQCQSSGLYGYSLRVLPRHLDLAHPHDLGLVHWAS